MDVYKVPRGTTGLVDEGLFFGLLRGVREESPSFQSTCDASRRRSRQETNKDKEKINGKSHHRFNAGQVLMP